MEDREERIERIIGLLMRPKKGRSRRANRLLSRIEEIHQSLDELDGDETPNDEAGDSGSISGPPDADELHVDELPPRRLLDRVISQIGSSDGDEPSQEMLDALERELDELEEAEDNTDPETRFAEALSAASVIPDEPLPKSYCRLVAIAAVELRELMISRRADLAPLDELEETFFLPPGARERRPNFEQFEAPDQGEE